LPISFFFLGLKYNLKICQYSSSLPKTVTIADCTMTYNITVSYSPFNNRVTRVRGNLTFSGSCSGSVDFDIDLTSDSDGTINELPVIYDVDVNNTSDFEQFLVREINQAIINN